MTPVHELKKQAQLETPLLLFECRLKDGTVERWSTNEVTIDGDHYDARVIRHSLFEMRLGSDEGIDASSRIAVVLANVDSRFSQLERTTGWKGAKLTVRFVFYDLKNRAALSEPIALFLGSANPPEEITESEIKLSFANRLNLQRVMIPPARIQPRCPWIFPATAEQRVEAVDGGEHGVYSRFHACGYSADQPGGCGNLNAGSAFTSCGYTKRECDERGMYREDSLGRKTGRFGGFQFLPPSTLVRPHGERSLRTGETIENLARANDAVPIIYGTAWYRPPVVFARNDGNLTHCEALLGQGRMEAVHKVVVNGVEIPLGVAGKDMGATGWYNVVSLGTRDGGFNLNFADETGKPLGDPHGSLAILAVAVPNRVANGESIPKVEVLADGVQIERFDASGQSMGAAFSRNPAWILLDVLRRCGWMKSEIQIGSFAASAATCEELIPARDALGVETQTPRFECNTALTQRHSGAEIVRGIRTSCALVLTFDGAGKLELFPESTLASQQPIPRESGNSDAPLDGGWPAYEFGDGLNAISGILRTDGGEPRLRLWSRSSSEQANRVSVEFQNAFNEYQQDSISVVDLDDVLATGQELAATLPAVGLPHLDQAARIARFHLLKSLRGNQFIEFETSVQALGLRCGDIITISYVKEGLDRHPFRVVKLSPSTNFETVRITAQWHEDAWYGILSGDSSIDTDRERRNGRFASVPRPIAGRRINDRGEQEFDLEEIAVPQADGTVALQLQVGFTPPSVPGAGVLSTPLVGLSPGVVTTGGGLPGGTSYYYAVSALNQDGVESELSFTVRATVPVGTDTNKVILKGISAPPGATGLRVYRGETPSQLLRICENAPRSSQFTDDGMVSVPIPPPDPNYDHANFHWRMELSPEVEATIAGASHIGNNLLAMLPNEFRGAVVRVTSGLGKGQERVVLSNDGTTLTLATKWSVIPDAASRFTIAEASWRFGGASRNDNVVFEVLNRSDTVVQISGRAANAQDTESATEISPLHRYRIGGGDGGVTDADTPPAPAFALSTSGRGHLELLGIGFEDLTNTRTVTAATLTLHYWNELLGGTLFALAAPADSVGEWLVFEGAGPAAENDVIQIGAEIMRVLEIAGGGTLYRVEWAACGSSSEEHDAGSFVWHLSRHVVVAPFPRDFFGSPASGAYVLSIPFRDARIAAAEFYATNSRGDSPTVLASYAGLVGGGLRTLSGGQYSIQLMGEPALEANVAPPLVVEEARSVGDVFATLAESPVGGPVKAKLRVNGASYCDLMIPPGSRYSPAVSGTELAPLEGGSELTLDVIEIPQGAGSRPGRNLTVTIRL